MTKLITVVVSLFVCLCPILHPFKSITKPSFGFSFLFLFFFSVCLLTIWRNMGEGGVYMAFSNVIVLFV